MSMQWIVDSGQKNLSTIHCSRAMQEIPLYRKLLLWFFVLVFLISAPLVVFYTAGYRWNPKKGAIERNGTLIIDTTPTNAQIRLNNDLLTETSPSTLKNLSPGTYHIELSLDGYHPWEKTVDIRPEYVTFVNEVHLWPDVLPELWLEGSYGQLTQSPNSRYLAGVQEIDGKARFVFIELTGKRLTPISFLEDVSIDDIKEILWSDDSFAVLIAMNDGSAYVANRKITNRLTQLPDGYYRWDDSVLIGALDGERYIYDASTDTAQKDALPFGVIDIQGSYQIIYATGTGGYALVDVSHSDILYSLPSGKWYFGPSYNGVLFLEQDDEWIGFDPDEDAPLARRLKTTGEPVITRMNGKTVFLSHHEGEIWSMVLGDEPSIVLRKSRPILHVDWHRDEADVFFATGQDVFAYEMRGGNQERVETPLAHFDDLTSLCVIKRELYLSGSRDGKEGIWVLDIE